MKKTVFTILAIICAFALIFLLSYAIKQDEKARVYRQRYMLDFYNHGIREEVQASPATF